MATIKTYTDIEQSKKLAKILPIESADMCYPPYYIGDEDGDHLYYSLPLLECKEKCAYHRDNKDEYIPCWSLAALFALMPNIGVCSPVLVKSLLDKKYYCHYLGIGSYKEVYTTTHYDESIDACYEMILKLHELNLL